MNKKITRPMFLVLTALCFVASGCDDSSNDSVVSEKEQNCINNGGKVYDDKEDKCYCRVDGNLQELISGKCSDLTTVTGDCKDGDVPKCDGDFILTCTDNKWQKAEEKCEYGCDKGLCKEQEEPPSGSCEKGEKKCFNDYLITCNEGEWEIPETKCQFGCENAACKEDDKPVVACDEGTRRCSGDYVQTCFNNAWVNASLKCPEGCEGNECKGDLNHNYMKDEFDFDKDIDCRKYSDCTETNFCDSFIGYKCSKKCENDSQCISDEYFCRSDGRCAPKAFVTEWKIDNKKKINFPLKEATECHFTIDWGDNLKDEVTECKDIEHEYLEAGTYQISVTGTLDGWKARGDDSSSYIGHHYQLLKVLSFGPMQLGRANSISNFWGAFYFCNAMTDVSHIDIPNLSKVVSTADLFKKAEVFNSPIDNWDMSAITNMTGMFSDANSFNQPIEHWDMSSTVDVSEMFENASAFNQNINVWDLSNVKDMHWMFYGATSFNQPIGDWNVSNVKDMRWMFQNAKSFDKPIGDWDTSSVTDMSQMFSGAEKFNQDIGNWNVSKVEQMNSMFNGAKSFAQNIGNWDVSNVRTTYHMFDNALAFNCELSKWNLSKAHIMNHMFYQAESFDQDLSTWKLDKLSGANNIKDFFTGSGLSKENYCKLMSESADAKWKEYIDVLGLKNKYTCN